MSTLARGEKAMTAFLKERIIGGKSMWDPMKKGKVLNWTDSSKTIKVKVGTKEVCLKAVNSLFARLLMVSRSSRVDVDLKAAINLHELSTVNHLLMSADGKQHPCEDKSQLIHLLEGFPQCCSLSPY